MSSKTLVIGVGNRYRGDDALGCLVAAGLAKAAPGSLDIIEHDGEPASLMDHWADRRKVILIDAVSSGAKAGMIHHFDLRSQSLPASFRAFSTHAFGIADAVELARALGKLPPSLHFYGVEGESFSAAAGLTAAASAAAAELQKAILNQIAEEETNA